jgi:hypothetical protein
VTKVNKSSAVRLFSLIFVVSTAFYVVSAPANATQYKYKEAFFYGKEINSLAIDSSLGSSAKDTYVAGYQLGVMKFDASHVLTEQLPGTTQQVFGVTVDQTSGDVYAADLEAGKVYRFDSSGVQQTPSCSVGSEPSAVAFDQTSHDLYVVRHGARVVDKLNATCEVQLEITGTPSEPFGAAMYGGLAVDQSTGDLYVADSSHEAVDRFSATGQFEMRFDGKETHSKSFSTPEKKLDIGIDQSTGDVYVADSGHRVIDEFSPSGSYLGEFNGAETSAGQFEDVRAVAVDQLTGDVYVGDSTDVQGEKPEHEVVDIFKVIRVRDVITGSASNVTPTAATLNGTVNPKGKQPTSCVFEYGPENQPYNQSVTCAQSLSVIGNGNMPVSVDAKISGLTQGEHYHFRLVTNSGQGDASHFITPVPPTVDFEEAIDTQANNATLIGRVNPGGGETSYHFEYGPDTAYGVSAPVPGGTVEADLIDAPVSVSLSGLTPSTEYHFRLVASNAAGTAYGADQTFITQPPGGPTVLPDGRSWELVSPANKNGALILTSGEGGGGGAALQAAASGNAITFSALGPLGDSPSGNAQISQIMARRNLLGWSAENISTPHDEPKGGTFVPEYHFFSFDLSSAIVMPLDETPLAPGGTRASTYLRNNDSATYTVLTNGVAEWYAEHMLNEIGIPTCAEGAVPSSGKVVGTSDDGCTAFFISGEVLEEGALGGDDNLYVSHQVNGEWKTRFIATLSSDDERDWEVGPESQGIAARVSPNGNYLAFMSDSSLTGYNNHDANSNALDEEVFVYDVGADRLVCASCNPTGVRPQGIHVPERGTGFNVNAGPLVDYQLAWESHWLAGSLTAARNTRGFQDAKNKPIFYLPRSVSDKGNVFFNSPSNLAPQDTNNEEDVYEYEPEQVGGCSTMSPTYSRRALGCIGLLSSGVSGRESVFLDASSSGGDVFFLTGGRLTSRDYDTSLDVYDAHACSSQSPCTKLPAITPECATADSCKAAPAPQPDVFGAPPSATFDETEGAPSVKEVRPKALTRAEKLAKMLRECRRRSHTRKHRARCEAKVRKLYRVKTSHLPVAIRGKS